MLFYATGHRYFKEIDNQVAVLEGFSLSIAIVIGLGQLPNALGLYGLTRHKEFYMNVYETFANIGDSKAADYLVFLIAFFALFFLNMIPQKRVINEDGSQGVLKAKMPWLVVIAFIGIIYGALAENYFPDIKPRLLQDNFPTLKDEPIATFDYLDRRYIDYDVNFQAMIPWSAIIIGSLKVALVAIIETQVSAVIAQKKYT
jgi:MFS superfamily sulfate permease-like transporter